MCWHKWTKWVPYLWEGVKYPIFGERKPIPCNEQRQKRHCEKCGKVQDEMVLGS